MACNKYTDKKPGGNFYLILLFSILTISAWIRRFLVRGRTWVVLKSYLAKSEFSDVGLGEIFGERTTNIKITRQTGLCGPVRSNELGCVRWISMKLHHVYVCLPLQGLCERSNRRFYNPIDRWLSESIWGLRRILWWTLILFFFEFSNLAVYQICFERVLNVFRMLL